MAMRKWSLHIVLFVMNLRSRISGLNSKGFAKTPTDRTLMLKEKISPPIRGGVTKRQAWSTQGS